MPTGKTEMSKPVRAPKGLGAGSDSQHLWKVHNLESFLFNSSTVLSFKPDSLMDVTQWYYTVSHISAPVC